MTQQARGSAKVPGDLTFETTVFGLVVLSMGAFLLYTAWSADQEVTPLKLSQAPAGCIADRLSKEVRMSAKPLTNQAYDAIRRQCDADEKLKEQRDALPRP